MKRFKNFDELRAYIEDILLKTKQVEEHRLHSEEQYQMITNKEVVIYLNSIQWIIRLNKILEFLQYSIKNTMKYISEDFSIIEDSEEKDMYTYYLEDSVYRLITGWDIYKQLINEMYEVGVNRNSNYSIYKLLKEIKKEQIWEKSKYDKVSNYLNSDKHKFVRDYLRNSFAHNTDPTSMNIFHGMDEKGKFVSDNIEGLIPKSPYQNILNVVDDLNTLYDCINEENNYMKNKLYSDIMLVIPKFESECGIEIKGDVLNIKALKDISNEVGLKLETKYCKKCNYLFENEGEYMCKPKSVSYKRIY